MEGPEQVQKGFVTTDVAAKAIGTDRSYIGRLVRNGTVAGETRGRRMFVDLEGLRAWRKTVPTRAAKVAEMRQRQDTPIPARADGPFARLEKRLDRLDQQVAEILRLLS